MNEPAPRWLVRLRERDARRREQEALRLRRLSMPPPGYSFGKPGRPAGMSHEDAIAAGYWVRWFTEPAPAISGAEA